MLSAKFKTSLITAIGFVICSTNPALCLGANDTGFIALLDRFKTADTQLPQEKKKGSEVLSQIASGSFPSQDDWHLLSPIRLQHPRLIILDNEIDTIRCTVKDDPIAKGLFEVLERRANQMLHEAAPVYSGSDEGGLTQSRLALKHLTSLAAMYRLTHDKRYFDRAREEMIQIAAYPDWGPQHFLNVAEMTAAMSIGYDWLFNDLTQIDRKTIRDAIARLGLEPGIAQYKGEGWWRTATHNWNFVCNGGLTMGALAVAEDEPVLAEKILACAAISTPFALHTFKPDGGWPEGPMYWTYGTRYLIYMLSSLQSAIGTDFGFANSKGLSETGFFRIYSEGPIEQCFNFADSETEVGRGSQMFWLSRRFKQPVFAGAELHITKMFPEMFHLLFYTRDHVTPADAKLPLNKWFQGIDVACMRSSWSDPNATYIGFKGGDNKSNHAHLDLGTFVLDSDGFRWALDLGPDDYELPGYFGKERWNYYRLRTEGHNTITVGRANQSPRAAAKIIDFCADSDQPYAIADLSEAYRGELSSAKRGVKLLAKDGCLIEDEIDAPNAVPIQWHLHTPATVTLEGNGRRALLTQHSKHGTATMLAEILSPPGAVFSPEPARSSAEQAQQPNVTDLIIPFKIAPGKTRIVVIISREQKAAPSVESLDKWKRSVGTP